MNYDKNRRRTANALMNGTLANAFVYSLRNPDGICK